MLSQPVPDHPHTNRLIHEKSPYLLQHAHNPVDWYPWGEEAFEAARSQNKPIFLSIGYATCHWCHVMEKESFEDPEIAKMMNEMFVNIKVDREELPQVDSLYMEFAQALMSTAGGWPLNLILTPELKPFFALTYLPPRTRQGLIGMDQFMAQIKQLWEGDERAALVQQADQLVETFAHLIQSTGTDLPSEQHVGAAAEVLFELGDPIYGGIKGEPKFPLGYQLEFLLQIAKTRGDSRALFYIELTLEMMYRGGIYDHLGGGFARYAVDEQWVIPHFEKMTYDNAILSKTYLEAWRYTKKPLYRKVVEETLGYMLREMMQESGGFFSGQDADSEGEEGRYYTWTLSEISQLLPAEETELFSAYFDVTAEGNFDGRNVLHADTPIEEFVKDEKVSADDLSKILEHAKGVLHKKREERERPFRDQKILTSSNGLMIEACASAGAAFNNSTFTEAAVKAAQFIREHLWKEGRLFRRFCDGEAKYSAALEDYAFLIRGLITLFHVGQGVEWLKWALELTDVVKNRFKAPKGAFYQTEEELIVKRCDFYDGAEPSGNGVHCENLLRLFQLTREEKYLEQAEDILKAAKQHIETYPPGACYLLMALSRYYDAKAGTLVVALDEKRSMEAEIFSAIHQHFAPHLVLVWKKEAQEIDQLLPEQKDMTPIDGKTALYICRQNLCEPGVTGKEEIQKAITSL